MVLEASRLPYLLPLSVLFIYIYISLSPFLSFSSSRYIDPFYIALSLCLSSPPELQACEPTVPCNCYLGNDLAASLSLLVTLSLRLSFLPSRSRVGARLHDRTARAVRTYLRIYTGAQVHRSARKIIDLAADLAAWMILPGAHLRRSPVTWKRKRPGEPSALLRWLRSVHPRCFANRERVAV